MAAPVAPVARAPRVYVEPRITVILNFENFEFYTLQFNYNLQYNIFSINLENETYIELTTEGTNQVYKCWPSQMVIKVGVASLPNRQGDIYSDIDISCAKPNIEFKCTIKHPEDLHEKLLAMKEYKDRLQVIARARNLAHAEQAGIIDPRARRVADGLVNQATQPALHKALENPYGWQQTVASFLAAPENQVTDAFKFKKNGTQNVVGLGPVLQAMKKKVNPNKPEESEGGRRKNKTRKNRNRKNYSSS